MSENVNLNRDHLAVPEAAKRKQCTGSYITRLLRDGKLEGFHLGRDWFVYVDSLNAYFAQPRKRGPKGPRKLRGSDDEPAVPE